MIPYLIVFILSTIATYNAQRCKLKNFTFYIHSCFAVLPLVLLSALRDINIGTDTINYVFLYNDALEYKDNLIYYILNNPSFEVGFLTYNFIIAQLISSVEGYYFITYGIIIGLTYASAIKVRHSISPHIFILVYFLLFFSDSLNVMRQYLAISFVFYAVANLFTGKYKQYIFWTLVSLLFHTSAIISTVIGLAYIITQRYPLRKNKFKYILICIIAFVAVTNMAYFTNLGLLPVFETKLDKHLTNEVDGAISNSHILICFCTLIFLLFTYQKGNAILDLMLLLSFMTFIIYMSPNMNATLYRLTLYFNSMICFAVSYVHKSSVKHKQRYSTVMLMSLYVCFYIFSIVISKTNEVIPYSSSILGL